MALPIIPALPRLLRAGRRRPRLLAAAAAALVLPLTAAPSALADTTPPTGTVVQQGGIPQVVGGGNTSATTFFTAHLPSGVQGPVSAVLKFDPRQLPALGTVQAASHLHSTCAVDDSAYRPCQWRGQGAGTSGPWDTWLRLALPSAAAAPVMTWDVTISADYLALPDDRMLTGDVQLTDATGRVVADAAATVRYHKGTRPASWTGSLYGRDAAGTLWRYGGKYYYYPQSPFWPRAKVGGGWNAYTAITPLVSTNAAGDGDMVARDKDGVLWYYRHSGVPEQPFAPRIRVGAGWNIYRTVAGTGGHLDDLINGTRSGDLVAVDRDGVMWFYRATGNPSRPFAPRVRVGAGWNAYTQIVTFGDGLLARDASGVLWSYSRNDYDTGNAPLWPRVRVGAGWNIYTALSGTWAGDDHKYPALVAVDKSGQLWFYTLSVGQIPGPRVHVGGGWNTYTALF
ncbi:tachylectin-related carbohydrate-binding protein [Actinacidiphila acididurans]|uniref:Tachylectin n=1 Tax=Actinacidiphila acididurans TaxID=2784346 RepID=A0ABS2TTB6_9ACTN|nr:tachylectin-related carbohydrate-binding protein [Actinacidiphila acididurans]MBM9506571.1 hypothetical protein [Actinacidiphila acididurans]